MSPTTAGYVFSDDHGLAGGFLQARVKPHAVQFTSKPPCRRAAVGVVMRIGRNRRKTQQSEQALKTLRKLLINFCENVVGMSQDFTSGPWGGNRMHCVTAAAYAARGVA